MLYPREDTTGALLHELRAGRLDLVLGFCPPPDDALERERLRDEPAVVHVAAGHPLARRERVALADLRSEPLLVAGGPDSPGYTSTVVALCRRPGSSRAPSPTPTRTSACRRSARASASSSTRAPPSRRSSTGRRSCRSSRRSRCRSTCCGGAGRARGRWTVLDAARRLREARGTR